jgi:hypothetical protein
MKCHVVGVNVLKLILFLFFDKILLKITHYVKNAFVCNKVFAFVIPEML